MKLKPFSIMILFGIISLFLVQCQSEEITDLGSTLELKLEGPDQSAGARSDFLYCGAELTESWRGWGYHRYPYYRIDIDCVPIGETIKIEYNTLDLPNKFSVWAHTPGGTLLNPTTTWEGIGNYWGPWSNPPDQINLNTPTEGTITFVKEENTTFYLEIETVVEPENAEDTWEVYLDCECETGGGEPGPGNGTINNCC